MKQLLCLILLFTTLFCHAETVESYNNVEVNVLKNHELKISATVHIVSEHEYNNFAEKNGGKRSDSHHT